MAIPKKPNFNPVDLRADFPKLEEHLLDSWYKNGVVNKYLRKNENSEKYFSFMDGPITANNPMGVHHAWGRTYKDLWQRFYNMQGYKQRFQNGFDCQGLWVEVEVEKELGFKTKKDIETYGVEKFVDKCRERVLKYSDIQTQQSKRLGYFMDWDNSYYTMSDENNYMIWHFIKTCHENGWLYKGNESVPWCPRCETAISQHEILTEDYKELKHDSIIIEFPVVGEKDTYLLVWTTTPWTIPANIAIAVDKNLDYVLVEGSTGDKFWLAEGAFERVFGKNFKNKIKTVKGSELSGLKYKGPYDDLPAVIEVAKKNPATFHTVVETDDRLMPITTEEGTGLVHTAVSAGTEDYRLGQKLGLPMIPVIEDDASYKDGFGEFSGKNAKNDPWIILGDLKKRNENGENWVFEIFKYAHRYPVCWRCKEELVWKVTDEWYIAMDKKSKDSEKTLRTRMKDVTRKIGWMPKFGLKRELDWLDNMHDWLISKKNRYWGLALPIWECDDCKHFMVIGSKEELKEKAVKGWDKFEGKTPHKPHIDEIVLKCEKCGKVANRIEPVGNPWLDAGIVSFSTVKEGNRGESLYLSNKKEWEKWFPADFITESFPGQFKNWFYSLIAMSTVLEDREPFKKVLGYATLLSEDGSPMHKSAGNMIAFDEGADKIGVDVMRWMYLSQNPSDNLLFGYKNADETRRRFYLKLLNVYNFFITYANLENWTTEKNIESKNILDIWIKSRLATTNRQVTESLENYKANNAVFVLEEFVDDLSNWYIRRSRERVGPSALDLKDKEAFYITTLFVLTELSKILAPFVPFVSDMIFTNLTKHESVHLQEWPQAWESNNDLEIQMKDVRIIAEAIHAKRKELNIAVRVPLATANVKAPFEVEKELEKLLSDEVNVLGFEWTKLSAIEIELNTQITPELEELAKTRELIRAIQAKRKEMEFDLTQTCEVIATWLPKDKNEIERIKLKTIASKLTLGDEFIVKEIEE